MNPCCRFSSTKHTTSPQGFLSRNSYLCLPKRSSPFFISETCIPKRECLHAKPNLASKKASFGILRIENSKLTYPSATLSSFAEAEGGEEQNQEIQLTGHRQHESSSGDDQLPGMAQAFNISSSTASAISICIAFAAFTFPFFMSSLGQGLALKTKLLSYATLLFGFYMAWNIGANDVANAMGTSVGSGALTLRQAVLTAAILEFSGALLMGTHVTSTMQKGILVANVFHGNDTLLLAGLLSSLAAAGTWLQVTISIPIAYLKVLYPTKEEIEVIAEFSDKLASEVMKGYILIRVRIKKRNSVKVRKAPSECGRFFYVLYFSQGKKVLEFGNSILCTIL